MKVVFAGNPNVGKTSLFNRITGSFEHVGNYPGVTVKRKAKTTKIDGRIRIRRLAGALFT